MQMVGNIARWFCVNLLQTRCRLGVYVLGVYVLAVGLFVGSATAQSVHPDVYLSRPTTTTYTQLTHFQNEDRPKVGLYFSRGYDHD